LSRLVLLDRDGTINVEREYLSDPSQLELLPGAALGILTLNELGCRVAVVTNQSGIGRGYYTEHDYQRVTARLGSILAAEGARVDAVFHCPHHPSESCDCRKPRPGMAIAAAEALAAGLEGAFVVGDKLIDLELGRAVGARTILVRTGYGALAEPGRLADHVAANLYDAALWICREIKADSPRHR
jgi:D-glycero-D-manno-heptose 1,7-bisphosphate phosphatase